MVPKAILFVGLRRGIISETSLWVRLVHTRKVEDLLEVMVLMADKIKLVGTLW